MYFKHSIGFSEEYRSDFQSDQQVLPAARKKGMLSWCLKREQQILHRPNTSEMDAK